MESFLLNDYLSKLSYWRLYKIISKCRQLMANGTFHSNVAHKVPLSAVMESFDEYKKNMTAGKWLVCP
jgi:NADPH:quinone reductase-like Zn-dependent oxidoreductase